MCREEAATVYLDVMLGFRCGYRKFQDAADVLSDNEKTAMQNAVFDLPNGKEARDKRFF